MNTKIWDICEDCGSSDIQFARALDNDLTHAQCRRCGDDWYDTYEGMWNDEHGR